MEHSRYHGLHQMILVIIFLSQIISSEEAYSERYRLKAPGENTGNSLISRMKYIKALHPIPIWGKNLMEYYIMMEYPKPPETVNNLGLRMNLLGAQSSDFTTSSQLFHVVEDTIHHTFTITFSGDISDIMMCSVTQITPIITDYSCHIQIQFLDLEGSEEGNVLAVHNAVLTILLNNISKVEVGIGGGDALKSCSPDTCQIKQVQTTVHLCEANGCEIREERSSGDKPRALVVDIPFSVFLGIPQEENPTRYTLQLLQVIWTNQHGEQMLNEDNSCVQNNTYTDIKYEEGGVMTFSCIPSMNASNVYLKILAQITPKTSLRNLNSHSTNDKNSAILGLAGPYIIYPKGYIIQTPEEIITDDGTKTKGNSKISNSKLIYLGIVIFVAIAFAILISCCTKSTINVEKIILKEDDKKNNSSEIAKTTIDKNITKLQPMEHSNGNDAQLMNCYM